MQIVSAIRSEDHFEFRVLLDDGYLQDWDFTPDDQSMTLEQAEKIIVEIICASQS